MSKGTFWGTFVFLWKSCLLSHFRTMNEKFPSYWLKSSRRVVETAFYNSPKLFWAKMFFFSGKKMFFFQTFSDLSEKFTTSLRKNFGQFFKTASGVSKQKLWEISISESNFLFYHNSWSLRENLLAFYRFPAVQMSKLHFACPKDKFDENYLFFKKILVSFTILGLWAKTFPTPGRKTSAGLSKLHERWLKEVFEDIFLKKFFLLIFLALERKGACLMSFCFRLGCQEHFQLDHKDNLTKNSFCGKSVFLHHFRKWVSFVAFVEKNLLRSTKLLSMSSGAHIAEKIHF